MVKNKLVFCEVLLILFLIISENSMITDATENTNPQYFCPDLTPQKSLLLDNLMGMWYGVEVIQHRSDKGYTGIHVVEACPVLHFSRPGPAELRLLWSERAGTVEYLFQIPNPGNPGFWMSFGPQNGSMVHKTYRQFAGIVQVMKAVANHVVLTFCSPNTELYSIILSRTKWLDKMEIRGVRNMLQRRSLQQFGIRETDCNDSSSIHLNSKHLFIQFIVLIVFLNKLFNPL